MESDNEGRIEAVREPEFGYIYFIESGPYYKIGKTVNLEKRTDQIIASISNTEPKLPFKPRLVAAVGTFERRLSDLERSFHGILSDSRLQGEWFQVERGYLLSILQDIEWSELPVWIEKILWAGYADQMEMPVMVPCPS